MTRHKTPRLDSEPFIRACELRDTTVHAVALIADVPTNHIYDAGQRWGYADRLACALGMHPCEIWGDAWWEIDATIEAGREASRERRRQKNRAYHRDRKDPWRGVRRSWQEWRLCRDRIELHRDEWEAA
jgi:hypothetical protein